MRYKLQRRTPWSAGSKTWLSNSESSSLRANWWSNRSRMILRLSRLMISKRLGVLSFKTDTTFLKRWSWSLSVWGQKKSKLNHHKCLCKSLWHSKWKWWCKWCKMEEVLETGLPHLPSSQTLWEQVKGTIKILWGPSVIEHLLTRISDSHRGRNGRKVLMSNRIYL